MRIIKKSLLIATIGLTGCAKQSDPSGIWSQEDGPTLAAFFSTTSSNSFYCLQIEKDNVHVQFLDSDKIHSAALQRTGKESFQIKLADKTRAFVIRDDGENGYTMLNFQDSRPVEPHNPGGRDGTKSNFSTLDQCVADTIQFLKDSEDQTPEEPITEPQPDGQ